MSRDEFIQALVQAILEDWLTEDQARDLLMLYDERGGLPRNMNPMGLQRLLAQGEAEDERIRYLMLMVLLGLLGMDRSIEQADTAMAYVGIGVTLGDKSLYQRERLLNDAQSLYSEEVQEMALMLRQGHTDLETWHREMNTVVRRHLTLAHILGAGALAGESAQQVRLRQSMALQSAYLARFGDQIAIRALQGRPMTAAKIGQRAGLYAGEARGLFYQENGLRDEAEQGPGWAEEFIAQDDDHTCGDCSAAQGYYLPGRGPMPGRICRGGDKCRCRRVPVYDLAIWDELALTQGDA